MQSVKRIEIVVPSQELRRVLDRLDQLEVAGYSVIRDVVGKGHGGRVSDDFDFASTTLSNVYILSFCAVDKVEAVVDGLRSLLNKYGGICYVSDAVKAV